MKKAVITGASGGLGSEITKSLLERGIEVVNVSRSLSTLNVKNIKTDLTNNDEIRSTLKTIAENHQDADLLILCTGVLHWNSIGEISEEQIDRDFCVNTTGAIKIVNGMIEQIKKNKGDIVVVGSTNAFKSHGRDCVYASGKFAIRGFIKALQVELKDEPIRIIGFHPGGFNSDFHKKAESNISSDELMDPKDLAKLLINILELPKNAEVSEIIINRK